MVNEIMKKIMVIGPSGAGKSEFSRKLHKKLNIDVYHLDNIFWNKDKTHINREEFDKKLESILSLDEWIIDGDYSRTYEIRMKSADTIIFLNYSLQVCLDGVESRIGKERLDIPWIEEEFDPEFKEWIINWYKDTLPITLDLLNKYKDSKNVIIFNSREEANNFIETINGSLNYK